MTLLEVDQQLPEGPSLRVARLPGACERTSSISSNVLDGR
jgi:hypothetical protein